MTGQSRARVGPAAAAQSTEASQPRRTQDERSNEARQRIVSAAIKSFGKSGFAETALSGVSQQAGYSRGLCDYHFGSKLALAESAIDEIEAKGRVRLFAPGDGDLGLDSTALTALCKWANGYLATVSRSPAYMRALLVLMTDSMTAAPELHPRMIELNRRFSSSLQDLLRRGVEEGSIRPGIEPISTALVLESLLRGLALQWFVDREHFNLADVQATLEATLLGLLENDALTGNDDTHRAAEQTEAG